MVFNYTALPADGGARRSGTIDAPNEEAAKQGLRDAGLTPLVVEPLKEATNIEDVLARFKDVPQVTLVYFSRQLATMISSGISPLQSIQTLAEQEENVKFKETLNAVVTEVESGVSLTEALEGHPTVFNPLYVSMVRAGEAAGTLDTSLRELANQLEKNLRLQRAIKSATTYPKVVGVFAFLIVSGLLMTIVPRFAKLFQDTVKSSAKPGEKVPDASLPAPTEFVVNLSKLLYPTGDKNLLWFGNVALRIVVFIAIFIAIRKGWKMLMRRPDMRAKWDGFKLRAPMRIGPLVQKVAVARFARTFSSLLRSGVPAHEAMSIVADASGNALISDAVLRARERMLAGSSIAEPLAASAVFPTMVTRMVEIGEETGQLDLMLVKVAEFFEEEVEMAINSLTSIIEPLMILIVGAAVGFVVIAIYLPMFKLYDLIGVVTTNNIISKLTTGLPGLLPF